MNTYTTDFWIIGGFLGSGKTTLLNHLIQDIGNRCIGVLVNDFGELGVDSQLIEGRSDREIVELNGGQIFCSCISGNFVKSMVELTTKQPDVILVEGSGLAKPSALSTIVDEILSIAGSSLHYCGFITVIDADRTLKLLSVVNAVKEQIQYADLVVLNKTDLASPKELQQLKSQIITINPDTEILETSFGKIPFFTLPHFPLEHDYTSKEFAGWGAGGRPKAATWKPDETLNEKELQNLVRSVSEYAFRIKGYIRTSEGLRFVSCSGDQIIIEAVGNKNSTLHEGLTVIVPSKTVISKIFNEALRGIHVLNNN